MKQCELCDQKYLDQAWYCWTCGLFLKEKKNGI